MSTIQRCLVFPAALLAMIVVSSSASAQCNTCASTATGFGFPSASGQDCCTSSGPVRNVLAHLHQEIEIYKADSRLNIARGDAWPLPFSCWDRENYYAILNQQYATGVQVAHTLTSEYFDPETNVLNQSGEMRVAWIMQKAPQAEKQIFVFEDQTGPTMDQRLGSIRKFTDRYYAHLGNATIARSQIMPNQIPARYQQTYQKTYETSQPNPVIPITSGETISSSVGN